MLKMKIVITIILAFLSGRLLSQTPFPVNSTNGTSTTTNLTRGIAAADSAFQYRTYFLDTASANRGRIDEVPGVVIRTAPNVIWLRNSTATAWIRQANINDIINITGCYALLNGGLVSWSGSGLTMDVSAADYLINCKEYSTITSQVTLSTADATYDRFDIIYVDTNSTVGVITGTASATPIFPQIDPASQLQLAVISVPAGATTPGDVSSIVIYNEDIEWTSGSIMSSGTVDFVSTNNPFIGTYNALMSANANGVIYWDTANPININDYTTLKMYVRIDGGFDNDLAAYLVYLRSGGNPITNPIYLTDYGLDLSISGSYQIVTIPITAFTFAGSSSDVFDGVQLKFNNGSAALHIDYVQLQGGIPNGNSPYITNIFRVPGVDSIYFTKNGINYAIKDSIGSGGGSSYTFTNGLVDNGSGAVGLDSNGVNPLTRNVLIDADGNDFTIQNASVVSLESNNGGDNSGTIEVQPTQIQIQVEESGTGSNIIYMNKDSTKFQFFKGQANIDSLREASNMTNKAVMVWETTTGRWERINKDSIGSGGGSSYTFPYSVVAPGNAIQLENDTTANPANYFYGRNSAGRRGWYPQSGITGVNLFNSDGTLTGSRTVQADGNDFFILNAGDIDMSSNSRVLLEADNAQLLVSDSIEIKPHLGKLKIDTLNNETSQNKLMGWVETTGADRGKVGYVTIGSGLSLSSGVLSASGGSSGITVGTTTITSGTNKRIPFNNSGVYSESANLTQETNQIKVTGTSSTTPLLVDAHEDATAEILQVNDNATKVFSVNVDGVLDLSDNSSAPSTPASGYGKVYSRADSLRFKNDAGTEFTLGAGGGSTDSTVVRNQRWKYRNTFERMDDFIETTPLGWIGTTTGGGGAAALVTDNILTNVDTTYWGVLYNGTGTTTTGKAISYQGNNGSGAGGYVRKNNNKFYVYEIGSVWLPVLSDSTGGTEIYFNTFGLIDWWASTNPTTGIQFIYDREAYGNYWAIRSDNAGSVSTVVTTIPIVAATKYTLRFEITNWHMASSGGSIRAYINDTEVIASSGTYPIVSNLPQYFTTNFALYPSVHIEKRAGTTNRIVYADWVYTYAELINR